MLRQCSWCGRSLGEKPPLENKSVTTGICPTCLSKKLNEIQMQDMAQADGKLTERHK